MKQKGGISAGTWREYLILAAVMLPLTFCVSCGQTELPPVNDEDSSDISIAHIIEEEPEENSSEVSRDRTPGGVKCSFVCEPAAWGSPSSSRWNGLA